MDRPVDDAGGVIPDPSNALTGRRWLILLSAVVSFFAVGTTFFAVPPLVPQLTAVFGLSHFEIGLLVGAIAFPAIVLSIPFGAAVDRWPARAAGICGLAAAACGYLINRRLYRDRHVRLPAYCVLAAAALVAVIAVSTVRWG